MGLNPKKISKKKIDSSHYFWENIPKNKKTSGNPGSWLENDGNRIGPIKGFGVCAHQNHAAAGKDSAEARHVLCHLQQHHQKGVCGHGR
jgi:hypothetical protein